MILTGAGEKAFCTGGAVRQRAETGDYGPSESGMLEIGASGARLALTASLELADRGLRRAVVTLRVGVGQGAAMLLEGPLTGMDHHE